MSAPYPRVRFRGRRYHGKRDALDTRPIAGSWTVGEVREFSPHFCAEYGRQCLQINGTPCEAGEECTCWAALFVAEWNVNAEKTPWFELVEPKSPKSPTTKAGKPASHQE